MGYVSSMEGIYFHHLTLSNIYYHCRCMSWEGRFSPVEIFVPTKIHMDLPKKSLEIVKSIKIPNGGSVMNDLPGCTVNNHLQQIHVKWVTDIHGSHHYVKHGLKKNYNSKTYFGITSQETIFRTMIHNRRHSTTKKKHTHTIHAWYINLHLAVCLW